MALQSPARNILLNLTLVIRRFESVAIDPSPPFGPLQSKILRTPLDSLRVAYVYRLAEHRSMHRRTASVDTLTIIARVTLRDRQVAVPIRQYPTCCRWFTLIGGKIYTAVCTGRRLRHHPSRSRYAAFFPARSISLSQPRAAPRNQPPATAATHRPGRQMMCIF